MYVETGSTNNYAILRVESRVQLRYRCYSKAEMELPTKQHTRRASCIQVRIAHI